MFTQVRLLVGVLKAVGTGDLTVSDGMLSLHGTFVLFLFLFLLAMD